MNKSHARNAREPSKKDSNTQETKAQLYKRMQERNEKYNDRQEPFDKLIDEKVEKYKKRYNISEQEAKDKRLEKILNIYGEKLVVYGYQDKNGKYKPKTDNDSQYSIFLLNKYAAKDMGKKLKTICVDHQHNFVSNLEGRSPHRKLWLDSSHNNGLKADPDRKNIYAGDLYADHHPQGVSSTVHLMVHALKKLGRIPTKDISAVDKFVELSNIDDSFSNLGAKASGNNYPRSLLALCHGLNPQSVFHLCQRFPDLSPLDPIPENHKSIKGNFYEEFMVRKKGGGKQVPLKQVIQFKENLYQKDKIIFEENLKNNKVSTIDDKKYMILDEDQATTDTMKAHIAAHDMGVVKLFPNGTICVIHHNLISPELQKLGLTTRDTLLFIQPQNDEYIEKGTYKNMMGYKQGRELFAQKLGCKTYQDFLGKYSSQKQEPEKLPEQLPDEKTITNIQESNLSIFMNKLLKKTKKLGSRIKSRIQKRRKVKKSQEKNK